MSKNLSKEIQSFQSIWLGGFRTGYKIDRNQKGLELYLKQNMRGSCCLEIGCGGGQWSKFIYELNIFDKIYCIDVLSADHNKFWEYVGKEKSDKIVYIQVSDFLLFDIPDNSLDYVFSYDVFCHISYSGQSEYFKNMHAKCKNDCKLLIMYADADKYFSSRPHFLHIHENEQKNKGRIFNNKKDLIKILIEDSDSLPIPRGRWYWVGKDKFLDLCVNNKYKVLSDDINIDQTSPITLFIKE